jgi:putative transposase
MSRKSQSTEEQIIRALKEVEAGVKGTEVCRRLGVTEQAFYRWKAKFGGMDVSDAQRLRALEEGNRKFKLQLAEKMLDVQTARRRVAGEIQAEIEWSQRRRCRALGFARSSALYRSSRLAGG